MFSFGELEMKYGPSIAHQCLVEIERAAGLRPSNDIYHCPESRLAIALKAQDAAYGEAA